MTSLLAVTLDSARKVLSRLASVRGRKKPEKVKGNVFYG